MALCTKQNVKDFLKILDTDKDILITALIPAAQSLIEEYCNRVFEKGEVTEYSNGGVDRICLKRYPLIIEPLTPLTVYEDGNRVYGEDTLVSPDDYYIDNTNGIIFFDYILEKTPGAIKIIYTGGYTIPITVATANRKRVSNVATVETNGAHGLIVGDSVVISGVSGTGYNGTWLVASVPNIIHLTFANTGNNETEIVDIGGIVTGDSDTIIPQAIKQVCVEMVARKLKTGVSGDVGLMSKGTPGGINVVFNQADLLPEAKIVLDIFRSWASG